MRPLLAHIRLDNLRHNYQVLRKMHGGKLLAVLKANAYGHGAVECAHALADTADGFAVACIEEALTLRQAGITLPIVLLEGVFEANEYPLIDQNNLWPVIQNQTQLDGFLAHAWQQACIVWLKMDSGMHRAGFAPAEYTKAHQTLINNLAVAHIVKMSHLACADDLSSPMTQAQINLFDAITQSLTGASSLANSAAILAHPQAHRTWGRAGIALYGASPIHSIHGGLKAVMRLSTLVFNVRNVAAGESIGYGAEFITQSPTRVGLIACGYADGYARLAGTDTPITVDGKPSRIIGRVSMDMITVDLSHLPEAKIGSTVELWGDQISVNDTASCAGTIAYELLGNIKRAKFIYSF